MFCRDRKKPQVQSTQENNLVRSGKYFEDMDLKIRLTKMYEVLEIETIGRQKKGHVAWYIQKCRQNKSQYEAIAAMLSANLALKIDWRIVATLHALEAGFDLRKQIHNGQRWDKRTTWVPKGRGPFNSLASACLDAFQIKKKPDFFDVGNTLIFLIAWNGWGYYYKGVLASPYVFSYSNFQVPGKYVSDGVYDPQAISLQVGAAVILKQLHFKG